MDNNEPSFIPVTQGYNSQTGLPRIQVKLRGNAFLGWEKTPVLFTTSGHANWDKVKNIVISAIRIALPDVVEIRMNILGSFQGYYYEVNHESTN